MLFVELRFFIFFALVVVGYWSLKNNAYRKHLLLVASYYFYGSWDWRFAVMLFVISSADYWFALRLDQTPEDTLAGKKLRKIFVALSLSMNLGVLGYFKYCNFFVLSAMGALKTVGFHLDEVTLHIILPVGVSFFTFQSLSYTIDVYRKEIPAVTKLTDYLTFSSFFPQLVAGPIVRPHYFLPQLASLRTVSRKDLKGYLFLFLVGFLKKTALADNVSPYVDRVFHNPHLFSSSACTVAVWLYAVQIYCDFSGYTDMAIAVAGMLGYKLVINFDAPYLAISIQQFWRKWHISLSNWIRDYIYISLGGRNEKQAITYRNLVITMLAGGLWHGAAWTFVIWGGAHGVALVVNQETRRLSKIGKERHVIWDIVGWFLTINFVCATWILFRAPNFDVARILLLRYFMIDRAPGESLPILLSFLPAGLLIFQYILRKLDAQGWMSRQTGPRFALLYGCLWAVAMAMLPLGYRPFIYFQF